MTTAASPTRATLPARDSKIALQLGDDRLVTVGLQRVDEEGALVLSIPHPQALAPGRPILVLWNRNDAWTPLPTRVAAPRLRPHPDAGRLRLVPEARPVDRSSVAGRGKGDGEAASTDTATAGSASASATGATAAAKDATTGKPEKGAARKKDAKAAEALAPGIGAWHGHHPTANVALRLGSGRVRTIEVRRVDDDGALVLSLPRPSMLTDGSAIEVAWSERREWFTANVQVAACRPAGHADAGLLRLLPEAAPMEHKERRASLRFPIKIGVRGRVEKSSKVRKGTTFSTESLDLSEGGVAFACEHELARGDVISGRLIGPIGQLGDEVTLLVRRVAPMPGRTDYRIATSFEKPSKAFDRAIKRHILSFA
jgi:hypothetical protein